MCIWTVAARKGANGCDLIQGQKDRDRCWSWHYLTEAFKKNNAAICDKAVINDFVAVCKEGVAQQSAHPDDPNIVYKMNSDSDRLDDLAELNIGTSPFIVDSDSDGVSDSDEMYVYHTDPTNPDTDGDGRIDGDELKQGKNIHVPD